MVVSGASVYAYLLGDSSAGKTLTDKDGYYSLRLKQGFIVTVSYDSPDKKLFSWRIADRFVVEKNWTLPTVIMGQKSPLEDH